jgi:hypothetical protein
LSGNTSSQGGELSSPGSRGHRLGIPASNTTLVFSDNFQLSGIAPGTIMTIAAFHLVRLIAPPHLRQDQCLEGTGRPHEGGEGAAIIIDEPGAYKGP